MKEFDFSARKTQLHNIVMEAEGKDRKSTEGKARARAERKLKQIYAIEELLENINPDAQLSEETILYIDLLTEEYVPGAHVEVSEGDDLIEMLEQYKDVKDLYKKILKQCEKKGLQIQGTKIVKK